MYYPAVVDVRANVLYVIYRSVTALDLANLSVAGRWQATLPGGVAAISQKLETVRKRQDTTVVGFSTCLTIPP